MAFQDEDLRSEIEDLFNEAQAYFERGSVRDAVAPLIHEEGNRQRLSFGGPPGFNRGFRTFTPNPEKTPERKASMAKSQRERKAADIRARLLAGERPSVGRRGRPPTAWFKIASELGIDFGPPPKAPRRPYVRRKITADLPPAA